MFNKIVVGIVSSVVLFACNVNDSTTVPGTDVVSSAPSSVPEAVKTQDTPSTTPVVSPVISSPQAPSTVLPVGGIVTDPLAVPSASVGTSASATSTVSTPVVPNQPAPAQASTSVVTPVSSTTTVK